MDEKPNMTEVNAEVHAKDVAVGALPLVVAFAEHVDFSTTATATSTYYATQPGSIKDEDKDKD